MSKRKLALTIFTLCLVIGCQQGNENLLGDDIRLFKGPAWELAQAVESQDTMKIKQIITMHKVSVNYQEPKFGGTLLEWAVWTNHYKSTKTLLENGADPNLQDYYDGASAFMYAAGKFETSEVDPKGNISTVKSATDIPSDQKDPTHLNSVDARKLPSSTDTYSTGDWIKFKILLPIGAGLQAIKN